jgi:hypothetical protein
MGHLTVTRHEGERSKLSIDPGVDTETSLKHLLSNGITLYIGEMSGGKVRVSIDASREILVLREELLATTEIDHI